MEHYHFCKDPSAIHNLLLKWFEANKREMPWRTTCSPYRTLVSEIMLQQTQVATVIPYFERWMDAYPTIQDLSKATEDDILILWKGLGYYSRGTRLLKASKMIVSEFDGKIPNNKKELLKISGIGPYTAGAILSIAYNQKEPLVDGNVIRVFSRLFAILKRPEEKISFENHKTVEDYIWHIAEKLLPDENVGFFNEALMELGSEICTSKNAKCIQCPLSSVCQLNLYIKKQNSMKTNQFFAKKSINKTNIHGDTSTCELCDIEDCHLLEISDIPAPKPRNANKTKINNVLYITDNKGQFFVEKRPSKGLLAGMWQFPMTELKSKDEMQSYLANLNCTHIVFKGSLVHVFTHFKQKLDIVICCCESTTLFDQEFKGQWITKEELNNYPLWTGMQKVYDLCNK